MIVNSTKDKAMNQTYYMALTMAFFIWMCIISRNIQPTKLDQCMVGLFRTPKLANNLYNASYSNIGQPWARLEIKPSIEPFFNPFIHKFVYLGQIELGPLWTYNFVFSKWVQSFAMQVPPFFTLNLNKSHTTILWPTCFVGISHLHPTILPLFSIKEQTLHFTLWWTHFLQLNLLSMLT